MTAFATCDRREFLSAGTRAVLVTAMGRALRVGNPTTLVVLLTTAAGETARATSRARGVTMGVEEAARSARLFGGDVRLERIAGTNPIARPHTRPSQELAAIVGGETADECLALASSSEQARLLYLNTLCISDDLRGRRCNRYMFHVAPSERMLAGARATNEGAVTAWDPSLQAFGADTLNQRFRARFDRPMDADAWAGWFAVKALAEATLRAQQPSTSGLIDFFESDRGTVDGHKGRPLSFRPWDHQLRQPLYVRSSPEQRIPTEVPRAAGDPSRDSRDVLDMLGMSRAESACHFHE